MLIESALLSAPVLAGASVLAALTFGLAVATHPWRGWLEDTERRAVWIGSLAMLGAAWSLHASFGPNLLCTAIVPALFAARLHEIVHRRLPRNYFVYFFVSVFFGSALAWNVAALARGLLLLLSGQPAMSAHVGEDYLALLPLMTFGEAFINGMLIATAAVYRPHWLMSFDDSAYLAKRP